jgi:hypothetical protein
MTETKRYPATAHDVDNGWEGGIHTRDLSQIDVARELAGSLAHGLPLRGGPLTKQLPDGSEGKEDGTVVSIVWASSEYDDGSRRVLGWYETGRN